MPEIQKMKPGMTEQKKRAILEELWLTYYNDTVYAKGLITEEQHNALRRRIKRRTITKSER